MISGQRGRATEELQEIAKVNGGTLPEGELSSLVEEVALLCFPVFFSFLYLSSQHFLLFGLQDRGQLKDVLDPRTHLRRTTLTLWLIWALSSFVYYGIILLTAQIYSADLLASRCGRPTNIKSRELPLVP